ncbi:SusC/RagA family TonB-linked outer membrane protein, partial [Cyclobacterium qasimii]
MKNNLLNLFVMTLKASLNGFVLMTIFFSAIHAEEINAQKIKSVQNVLLNVKLDNANLSETFQAIEQNTYFKFAYDKDDLNENVRINFNKKDATVEDLLMEVSRTANLKFKQVNDLINVNVRDYGQNNDVVDATIQRVNITGRVTSDEDNEGLPGVTVLIKGTTQGTVTDVDGNFRLNVQDENAVLVFSSMGFISEEVIVGNQAVINVVLTPDLSALEEVVVIGYGSVKKSDLTGAVSSVPTQFLKNQPIRSITDLLVGRVSGVTLSRSSGDVGSPSKIRIRGANSISGDNSPLMVVDGVIGGTYGSIHDIESMEVLKDASATAIYGERASNGVILITTKKASEGGPKLRLLLNTGLSYRDAEYPDLMNAGEYAGFINDFYQTDIFSSQQIEEFNQNGGTNWPSAISQTGLKTDYNLSYSDNYDKASIYLSGRYAYERGNMLNSTRGGDYYLRSNIGLEPSERLKINLDIRAQKTKTQNGGLSTRTAKGDPLMQAILWSPTEPIWLDEEAGIYNLSDHYGALSLNPYMNTYEQNKFSTSSGLYATLNAKYEIADGLTYDVTGYTSRRSSQIGNYQNIWLEPNDPYADRSSSDIFNWRLINNITYNKTFNDAHNLILTGVFETEGAESWSMDARGRKMPLPDLSQYYVIGLSNEQSASSGYGESSRVGYLARGNYNYKSRYYFTGSYRIDGKSGPNDRIKDNKFGGFPSMAASWRISEEPFMQQSGVFDNLKLRSSWGMTGNPSGFYATVMKSNDYDYGIGANLLGYVPGVPANPNIRWEETTQLNFGLDVSILEGKLSFSADFFDKVTSGLLTKLELPAYYGYGYSASYLQNLGKINNTGFEFTMDYNAIQTQSFLWDLNFNISTYTNEVRDLGDQGAFMTGGNANGLLADNAYRVQEGSPLGTMWGYKWLGIWSAAEADE